MIEEYGDQIGVKAIKSELKKSFPDNYYFAILSGFYKNLTNIQNFPSISIEAIGNISAVYTAVINFQKECE